jgi:hypothetical protein
LLQGLVGPSIVTGTDECQQPEQYEDAWPKCARHQQKQDTDEKDRPYYILTLVAPVAIMVVPPMWPRRASRHV